MYPLQGSPRIRAEMSRILSLVQRKAGQWYACLNVCACTPSGYPFQYQVMYVCMHSNMCSLFHYCKMLYFISIFVNRVGLSVVHLGDRDVPNGKPDMRSP